MGTAWHGSLSLPLLAWLSVLHHLLFPDFYCFYTLFCSLMLFTSISPAPFPSNSLPFALVLLSFTPLWPSPVGFWLAQTSSPSPLAEDA